MNEGTFSSPKDSGTKNKGGAEGLGTAQLQKVVPFPFTTKCSGAHIVASDVERARYMMNESVHILISASIGIGDDIPYGRGMP
jgi:hypothetical protein